jgi:hypothetical protein
LVRSSQNSVAVAVAAARLDSHCEFLNVGRGDLSTDDPSGKSIRFSDRISSTSLFSRAGNPGRNGNQ